MALSTLADVKAHLNKTSTADDDELQNMLDAASDVVTSIVGDYTAGTRTETAQVHGDVVLLAAAPAGPVTVTDRYGRAVTGFTVNAAARLLLAVPPVGPVTVTYPVGGGPVPAAVKLATEVITAHLWETQRGTSPSALALQAQGGDAGPVFGAGFAVPNRARELLEPFAAYRGQIA